MSGASPKRQKLEPDETLVEQGETGDELFLLLDGVLAVEVDGEEVAELGPGAILGELAGVEGGKANRDPDGTYALPGRGRSGRSYRPLGT